MTITLTRSLSARRLAELLVCAFVAVATSYTANAQGFSVNITVDENGNGRLTNTAGANVPLPFALQADPGPGGLASTLTYSLLGPPGLTAGDLRITEPDLGGALGDVVRFNPTETCSGGTGCLVFYSASPPFDSLADTPSPPLLFYPNTVTLSENASGQVIYTPTAGQPGFVTGAAGPVTYDLISDVPEPASLTLLGIALAGFGFARNRRLRKRS